MPASSTIVAGLCWLVVVFVIVTAGFSGVVVVCGSGAFKAVLGLVWVCVLFCRCFRAFGGCLGMKGRRRTLQPAICLGELASEC